MSTDHSELNDDILVAFADEELSKEEMARLKPLIEADAEATNKVNEFKKSAAQLRDYFNVDVPEITPPDIIQKIEGMTSTPSSSDNVVSLASYRQAFSRGFKTLASGAGLQKLAASLVIGAFVGVGGLSQFGDYGQIGLSGESQLKVRGSTEAVPSDSIGLVLESSGKSYQTGSTISKLDKYSIQLKTDRTGKIWLLFHESTKAPVTLINGATIGPEQILRFPTDIKNGIKFDTDAPFVNFEVKIEGKKLSTRDFYVFGID